MGIMDKYYCEVKSVCSYAKNKGYASAITADWAK
jgi:hypothetical protein